VVNNHENLGGRGKKAPFFAVAIFGFHEKRVIDLSFNIVSCPHYGIVIHVRVFIQIIPLTTNSSLSGPDVNVLAVPSNVWSY
jgi:hypothetical protein